MRSPSSFVLALVFVAAAGLVGAQCGPPKAIKTVTPADGTVITTFSFGVSVELGNNAVPGTLDVKLNGSPVVMSGGPTIFTATVNAGAPLLDQNLLLVKVNKTGGGIATEGYDFQYLPPKARAFQISDPADCITGPLAHCRVDDWMLSNGAARFVIQNAPQRDFNQVGAYGGNIIDAEVVEAGVPQGNDNFWEVQPAANVETVFNHQSVEVVNDGQDGTAAIIRACGPDDLLDGINPSSVIGDAGGIVPGGVDDLDFEIEGCTEYSLLPEKRWITLTTTIENMEDPGGPTPNPLPLYIGDYISGAGELEQITPLSDAASVPFAEAGIGEMLVNWGLDSMSYFGFDEAAGTDYALIGKPGVVPTVPPSSSFTTTGVSYVMHGNAIPLVLAFGAPANFFVPAGGSASFTRWFAVGDGSSTNGISARLDILGLSAGTLKGCVTEANGSSDPIVGARVVVARDSLGGVTGANVVRGHWVTGADGCYEGELPPGDYLAAVGAEGFCYEGGCGTATPSTTPVTVTASGTTVQDFSLPEAATLRVNVTDSGASPLPARVGVVGFDPSPERFLFATFLSPNDVVTNFLFDVTRDGVPAGLTRTEYADASGVLEIRMEPGSYQVAVSRGGEYDLVTQSVSLSAGVTTTVNATLERVIDTTGYISSDFHTHLIDSPDSRISWRNRIYGHAGEGVENIVTTDHSVVTDLDAKIASLGLAGLVHSTNGEEITTFDTGHYNAYPQGLDPSRAQTRGSTDWAGAAPAGEDFPSNGNYILSPAQIEAAVLSDPDNAGLSTVVQINHIGSHFGPLQIDTGQTPPTSNMPPSPCDLNSPLGLAADCFRLDPSIPDFFHHFGALEIWNGVTIGHQNEFIDDRIGIWMNLLSQGLITTFIADTDTHTYHNLRQGGARTWTPSSSDDPALISDTEIGQAIMAGKAVGGQGLYLQARLEEGAQVADFSLAGSTLLTTNDGNVDLVIDVQAPTWAPYDTIEIYANASTSVSGTTGGTPTDYCANPTQVLDAGTDFTVTTVPVGASSRLETTKTVSLSVGTTDTWVIVLAKGTPGVSPPMFPVHVSGLQVGAGTDNPDLASLINVTAAEAGIRSLAATNALYIDADGNAGFDAPGVNVLGTSPNCAD